MPNVIADTSPIQYLYQTNLLDLLPQLYGSVIVPQAVANELAALVFRLDYSTRMAVLKLAGELSW
ncbi:MULTISPECIES: hypothetical protein [Moorena]|uniref:PIN domain-containing protein n=1 Tax=Moorena producens 3L TaxID=489825 RepID=F4XIT9_9CYAN|nr:MULTISPECIES: hypothetical protein [Moorena]EGJ35396.1 hypothetical protein LYNGBM3L_04580 [Moorena producens 3L]OLT64907.1 hypothetical protein BI334_07570 [Moorena producens 3L]